ncbi:MAG: hypothetical protein KIT00_10800, partial [Rhodospirillales bacterium]|nr:hypothetical protein [Rhodospirillales bacterium]
SEIAKLTAGKPPLGRIPHGVVMPLAFASETWCRLFGGEPFATRDGVRMSKKRMFFSSDKACRDLGYAPRPAADAIRDAVIWFRDNGYVPMAHDPTNKHSPLLHDRSASTGHR